MNEIRIMRSSLMTPASRPDMMEKVDRYAPDVLTLDLEDAVPVKLKEEARRNAQSFLAGPISMPVFVRINSWETGLVPQDLDAIVGAGLAGVKLPKIESVEHIHRLDALLGPLERTRGLPEGSIKIHVSVETALALVRCFDLAISSPRVISMGFGSAENADLQRDLGCGWSLEGTEFLYGRSRVVAAGRAAGLRFLVEGAYSRIHDLVGLRQECELVKRLGFMGRSAIHPSHIPIINEVFSPRQEEVEHFKQMMEAFAEAEARGLAAIDFEGRLVDYAMVKQARRVLDLADAIGML